MSSSSTLVRALSRFGLAVALPASFLVVASSAQAAPTNTICVGAPVGVVCDSTAATINAAVTSAGGNQEHDLIAVGPGTYDAAPLVMSGGSSGLTVEGSGDETVITLPPGGNETYVLASDATLRKFKVLMNPTDSTNDWAVAVADSTVEDVTIEGTAATGAVGMSVQDSTARRVNISLAPNSGRGLILFGDAEVSDAVVTAGTGAQAGMNSGVQHITRSRINATAAGISLPEGEVSVDNTLINMGNGTNAVGLRAGNFTNGPATAVLTADHVTVVGGGSNSRGAYAWAAVPTGKHNATVLLSNSVIHGPTKTIEAAATNDGNQGGSSEAFVGVSYTAYDDETAVELIEANGTGGITEGAGNLDVDPQFTNAGAGNYVPAPGSPLIDAGNPAAGTSTLDVVGNPRVADGNGDITAVRDLGAYEVPDTFAPQTVITGSTASPTRDRTPTFAFSSEPGATFTCKVDAKPAVACTSPFTAPSLIDGTHKLTVTAKDVAANPDPTPAVRSVVVDTVAPNTRFVTKPPKVTRKTKVRFTFVAPGAVRYQCRLDAKAWRVCTSPRVFAVTRGTHTFAVRAIDRAGNLDKTPARYRFRRA